MIAYLLSRSDSFSSGPDILHLFHILLLGEAVPRLAIAVNRDNSIFSHYSTFTDTKFNLLVYFPITQYHKVGTFAAFELTMPKYF